MNVLDRKAEEAMGSNGGSDQKVKEGSYCGDPSLGTLCAIHAAEPGKPKPVPEARHVLEDILSSLAARRILGWLAAENRNDVSRFEQIFESYECSDLPLLERCKLALPHLAIGLSLKRAGLDKEAAKNKLFHHHPTVRALALTARRIAHFGLTAPQRFVAPLHVVWNITRACNLECHHSYENATHKPAKDGLTLEEKIGVVDELAKAGVPFLAIAGGEPLVCKDLWPAVEYAHKRGIHLTLASNGNMITPEVAARLVASGVKYVEVGIDSIRPEEHDAFRGMRGSWARSVQGIRNLVQAGMGTGLAMCFTRKTYRTVDDSIRFALELGCRTFSHFNFIPAGRGEGIVDSDLTPKQREWLLQRLGWHLQEGKITVISTAPQFGRACVTYGSPDGVFAIGHAGKGLGKQSMVLARYGGGCGAGRCYCAIQPNGEVTPCLYISSRVLGNLRSQSFGRIWDCELSSILSDCADRGGHCRACNFRAYCGGCRARALAYTGNIKAGDPGCFYNRAEMEELPRPWEWPEQEWGERVAFPPLRVLPQDPQNVLQVAAAARETSVPRS
jgi:radical SAM protein with 4Fe4S-binding SPASM domain